MLFKKMQKPQFRYCLKSMAVEGQCESYFDYTRDWFERVNRGELFRVNDAAYSFFRECLSTLFSSQPPFKQSVLESIVKDENVLFSWAMAAETESPAISNELL